jgi:hypothetical protein
MQQSGRAVQQLPMTDAEMIFNHITVRVPGPDLRFLINPLLWTLQRACDDAFAAMVRLVDAKDPSYRS